MTTPTVNEDTSNVLNMTEIVEVIQSCNLNFLIGSGLSTPFLPMLNDIETKLSKEKDVDKRIEIYKEYCSGVMLPNIDIIKDTIPSTKNKDFKETSDYYKDFFRLISQILLKRKSTILSKQANIFTTNIDIFMETIMEESNLDYNDGFNGQLNQTFSLSNFKRSISKRSPHFDNLSEIPVFNLIKVHGSLTWNKVDENTIVLSKLDHFDKNILEENGQGFINLYEKIIVVNPEPKKLQETVMDLQYYELLRMYSSELEKENSVLFVMGFSMADDHIREITIRLANSNPTLKIYIFCHSKSKYKELYNKLNISNLKYSNIDIIAPINDLPENQYNLNKINDDVFSKITQYKPHNNKDDE